MHLYSKCCDIRIDKSKNNFFEASSDILVSKLNQYIEKIRFMKKKSGDLGEIVLGDIICKSCNSLCNYLKKIDEPINSSNTNPSIKSDFMKDRANLSQDHSSNSAQLIYTEQDMTASIEENQSFDCNSIYLTTQSDDALINQDVIYEKNVKLETCNRLKRDSISISIPRTITTHKYCILCKSDKVKLKRLTMDVIIETFIMSKILIPNDSRCCLKLFDDNGFLSQESIENLNIASDTSSIGANDLAKFFCNFRKTRLMNNSIFDKFNSFSLINSEQTIILIGFTKEEMFYIVDSLKCLNDSPARSKCQAVVVYLFWLRSGLSQDCIAGV